MTIEYKSQNINSTVLIFINKDLYVCKVVNIVCFSENLMNVW